jgi:hypothetical protein
LPRPVILLADGKHNSLAAALEISSWVRQQGEPAEIVHGDGSFISARLRRLVDFQTTRRALSGRIGIIGEPSDWLIASAVDRGAVKKRWGTDFIDIALSEVTGHQAKEAEIAALAREFTSQAAALDGVDEKAVRAAARLVPALKAVFLGQRLQAATLRCFSLIEQLRTSGCLALSKLNDEGLICGCEGDVPRDGMNSDSAGFAPARLRIAAFASLGQCDGNGLLERFFLCQRMAGADRSILLPVIHQCLDIAADGRSAGSFFERHDIPPLSAELIGHAFRIVPGFFPQAHRPSRIKTPVKMAKTAITMGRPSKCKLSNGISPVMMSQMPSKIIPRFFVSLNLLILFTSFFCLSL